LAEPFMAAARRGVRVIVETHSDLLLRSIQTLVTKGEIPAESVALYWFSRSLKDGATKITPGRLDKRGAYGDWPSDLDTIALGVESGYLDAASAQHSK
jgi:predicted ATPase